jgi:hypothetical protein
MELWTNVEIKCEQDEAVILKLPSSPGGTQHRVDGGKLNLIVTMEGFLQRGEPWVGVGSENSAHYKYLMVSLLSTVPGRMPAGLGSYDHLSL